MPLEYQRGTVFVQGKRRKVWYGKYRTLRRDPLTNACLVKQRTKKLGLRSEMTKFEAEDRLRSIIAEENKQATSIRADVAPKDLTLEWFVLNRHLPMLCCRDTTKKKTAYDINRYILQQFGHRPLKDVGLFDLQMHLNKLAKNFSDSVVRHTYTNLRSIFNAAVDLDFIAKSPARRLKMPETRLPDKSVLPAQTIMELLEAVEDAMDKCVLAVGIFCALRTAEVFGLTWGCYRGDCLAIVSTAFEGRLQKHRLKTTDSRALVPIPDLVKPIIEKWRQICPDASPDALMFSTTGKGDRKGQAVAFDSTNFMERRIHPVADRLGIPRRLVTFQVMRRTVATDLQRFGTLKDVQSALRHKSAGTTINTYMQPIAHDVRKALNARAEAVLKQNTTTPSSRRADSQSAGTDQDTT